MQDLGPEELSKLLVACFGAQHRAQLCLQEPAGEPWKATAISWLFTRCSFSVHQDLWPWSCCSWSCEGFEGCLGAEKSKSRQQPLWLHLCGDEEHLAGKQQHLDVLLTLVAMPEGCWCQWVQMNTEEIIFVTLRWSN